MSLTFLELALKVLSEEDTALTPAEIWKIGEEKGYDKLVNSSGKTPTATLSTTLYHYLLRSEDSEIYIHSENPKRYALSKPGVTKTFVSEIISKQSKLDFLEKDLHPVLAYFVYNHLNVYSKTINHSRSTKKGFNEWIHPDVVGCYFPFQEWREEVFNVSTLMANSAIKLYSFEIKRELSDANLRESFFQAVSNSSWANEGYLVASLIDSNEEFLNELKRLCTAFGIGLIRLEIADPNSSKIMFPAKAKDFVDWETVNKLAKLNPDFKGFLERIKRDIETREVREELYDKFKM
ncbi:HTH domain-containing protein [Synechococcus sp. PCC 6312]|uniref:HTH domain-containing protein n=1 Tax=Synechococcus sp. (strain ATCC 27167 / PCC 6312) TaxID=195253 RepID=UPI00029ECE1B|nr:HTH domain-containing protein [Synechococcus sp. PCC 6312]AFY60611.1 hypothetical protein Syn6312_1442 [Synechococcus sp. PCC 6312]